MFAAVQPNQESGSEFRMGNTQRVALVTGGMGGLGEAICIKLAALGDTVVTTYSPRNTKAQEWLRTMRSQGFSTPTPAM
jgi:acetoacetyl-CoA reductase